MAAARLSGLERPTEFGAQNLEYPSVRVLVCQRSARSRCQHVLNQPTNDQSKSYTIKVVGAMVLLFALQEKVRWVVRRDRLACRSTGGVPDDSEEPPLVAVRYRLHAVYGY